MFLLHLIPGTIIGFFVILLLVIGGLITLVTMSTPKLLFKLFPGTAEYVRLLQLVGVIFLTFGVYLKGANDVEMHWKEQNKILKIQLKNAEEQSKLVNTVIKEKIVTKIEYVSITKAKNRDEIVNSKTVKEFEHKCPLPSDIILLHNGLTK